MSLDGCVLVDDRASVPCAPGEDGSALRREAADARGLGSWKGLNEMIEELVRFWFVAAVFHAPQDLAAAVAELRARELSNCSLLVLANQLLDSVGEQINRAGAVPVLAAHGSARGRETDALPRELRALVKAMDASGPEAPQAREGAERTDEQVQVYGQLRQDVAGGAMVLVANVANSDEQLLGARILLHANSVCVLTHEISARGA
jgi:hypothetical protein